MSVGGRGKGSEGAGKAALRAGRSPCLRRPRRANACGGAGIPAPRCPRLGPRQSRKPVLGRGFGCAPGSPNIPPDANALRAGRLTPAASTGRNERGLWAVDSLDALRGPGLGPGHPPPTAVKQEPASPRGQGPARGARPGHRRKHRVPGPGPSTSAPPLPRRAQRRTPPDVAGCSGLRTPRRWTRAEHAQECSFARPGLPGRLRFPDGPPFAPTARLPWAPGRGVWCIHKVCVMYNCKGWLCRGRNQKGSGGQGCAQG